jgi:phosphocarrier protein
MPKIEKEITIKNAQGLHARPAALFVQIISKYQSEVNVKKDGETVSGRSIMGLLTLGIQKNTRIIIEAEGDDAEQVINEIVELLNQDEIQ